MSATNTPSRNDGYMESAQILRLYVAPGHNFFGRHGQAAEEHPIVERREIHCFAGRGIEGDRFFDYKPDYKGQITFFAHEVYQSLCDELGVCGISPCVFRRNVITRDLDLNSLIGVEFTLQGVTFLGTGECKPCYWMNSAFHPAAEVRLQGQGGLRAKILTTGRLRATSAACDAALVTSSEVR